MIEFDKKIELQQRKNDLLTVGELLIDMISGEYDESFSSSYYQKYFGGSPSNIAMNVKRLGAKSMVASAVGQDGLGQYLIENIAAAGISTEGVQQVEYSTSMVLVTKSKERPIPIFYRDADFQLSYTDQMEESLVNSNILHFSSWPISRKPARETIEKLISVARKHRLLIGFDPNYHPMLWERGEDGLKYIKDIIGKVDIVKPSEDDAERLFGRDTHENQVEKFLSLGAKLVVLTLGKDGALVSNGKETLYFPTLATKVVDSTGAGDAFWSGFYTGVIKQYSVREALQLGLAVSAYKLQFTGAVVDLPTLDQLKELYTF